MKKILYLFMFLFFAITFGFVSYSIAQEFSDPGRTIEVYAGQSFTLTLESNRTTGFQWRLSAPLKENIVRFVSDQYLVKKARFAGGGGKEVWVFRAMGKGEAYINFAYARPWEKNVAPAKEVSFKVVVKER